MNAENDICPCECDNCDCTRRWQCPSCNHTIDCSYEQIVEIGTPHCPDCEIEMTLV